MRRLGHRAAHFGLLSLQIGRRALDNLAATLEHLRCVVSQFASPLVHLLTALQHFLAGVGHCVAALQSLLHDFAPSMFTRSRRVEQRNRCSDRNPRHEPNYFGTTVVIRHRSSSLLFYPAPTAILGEA